MVVNLSIKSSSKCDYAKNEDCVIMRLLRNEEVDGIRQCYRKSSKLKEIVEYKSYLIAFKAFNNITLICCLEFVFYCETLNYYMVWDTNIISEPTENLISFFIIWQRHEHLVGEITIYEQIIQRVYLLFNEVYICDLGFENKHILTRICIFHFCLSSVTT